MRFADPICVHSHSARTPRKRPRAEGGIRPSKMALSSAPSTRSSRCARCASWSWRCSRRLTRCQVVPSRPPVPPLAWASTPARGTPRWRRASGNPPPPRASGARGHRRGPGAPERPRRGSGRLAERVESHDSIRQIFRDALLRASRATSATRRTSAPSSSATPSTPETPPFRPARRGWRTGARERGDRVPPTPRARMAEELDGAAGPRRHGAVSARR